MTRILVFDTETVPCLVMGARVLGIDAKGADPYEHMAAARLEERDGKDDFQKPFAHRIVGLGMVLMDTDLGAVSVRAEAGEAEPHLLRLFHSWLAGGPVLVGWNTLGFDLPVIRYRAMYHGLPIPRLYVGMKGWEKYDARFSDVAYDLCDVLSGYGRSTSLKLSEAAALCGFPCKTDGDGGDVLARFRAGDFDWIRRYVGRDGVVTARIFLRWQLTRGSLERSVMEMLDAKLSDNSVGTPSPLEPELALGGVP